MAKLFIRKVSANLLKCVSLCISVQSNRRIISKSRPWLRSLRHSISVASLFLFPSILSQQRATVPVYFEPSFLSIFTSHLFAYICEYHFPAFSLHYKTQFPSFVSSTELSTFLRGFVAEISKFKSLYVYILGDRQVVLQKPLWSEWSVWEKGRSLWRLKSEGQRRKHRRYVGAGWQKWWGKEAWPALLSLPSLKGSGSFIYVICISHYFILPWIRAWAFLPPFLQFLHFCSHLPFIQQSSFLFSSFPSSGISSHFTALSWFLLFDTILQLCATISPGLLIHSRSPVLVFVEVATLSFTPFIFKFSIPILNDITFI